MNEISFGSDFGQKVDLTASIRGILRNYPEGTSILKELIQNADDAGARKVSICLDLRYHESNSLAGDALSDFQGPSLLIYNDAVFTEEDFLSIQRIGDSLKNVEEKSTKIGRFGIGFNSVYHWTDLPSFISKNFLVMLDPQAKYLPNVNPSNPGKIIDWISSPGIVEKYYDQFKPFMSDSFQFKGPFNGTLFRLPLRTKNQADHSLLSKRNLTTERVYDLLNSLIEESSQMLLFLKNIESIEVTEWLIDSTHPSILSETRIHSIDSEMRNKRKSISNPNLLSFLSKNKDKSYHIDYVLKIKKSLSNKKVIDETWEVFNQFGSDLCNEIAFNGANKSLRLVPYGGVAACVQKSDAKFTSYSGLGYCFLPLPISTGLPVMINGFFELSSNRRDIWHSADDMTGDGRTRASWNTSLLTSLISPCYVRLLHKIKSLFAYSEPFQHFWPSSKLSAPWIEVSKAVYQLVQSESLLYAEKLTSDSFPSISVAPSSWIKCQESILFPNDNSICLEEKRGILEVFSATSTPIVHCSDTINDSLIEFGIFSEVINPSVLRRYLKNSCQSQSILSFKPEFCSFLFRYCFSDLSIESSSLSELNQLGIVPLRNGSVQSIRIFKDAEIEKIHYLTSMGFQTPDAIDASILNNFDLDVTCDTLTTEFSNSKSNVFVFFRNEAEDQIFHSHSRIIVNTDIINPNELKFISNEKFQMISNLKIFSPEYLKYVLRDIMHPDFLLGKFIDSQSLQKSVHENMASFIEKFWSFMNKNPNYVSALSGEFSVVPSGSNATEYKFWPLLKSSRLIACKRGDNELTDELIDLLESLGAHTLHLSDLLSMDDNSDFWKYVFKPTRLGVLTLLSDLFESDALAFENLSIDQTAALKKFVIEFSPLYNMSSIEIGVLQRIPLFYSHGRSGNLLKPICVEENQDVKLLKMQNNFVIPLNLISSQYFYCRLEGEFDLLKQLGVHSHDVTQFIMIDFIPSISLNYENHPSEVLEVSKYILYDLKALFNMNSAFAQEIKDKKFVLSQAENQFSAPSELFDPAKYELLDLLDAKQFPSNEYDNEHLMTSLLSLGMRKYLDWDGILFCAKDIAALDDSLFREKKVKRANSLLYFLVRNFDSLVDKKEKSFSIFNFSTYFSDSASKEREQKDKRLMEELLTIEWVPCLARPMHIGLPWPMDTAENEDVGSDLESLPLCASPMNTNLIEFSWLCSASKRITDISISNPQLLDFFGWNDSGLSIEVLCTQLKALAHEFKRVSESAKFSPTDVQSLKEILTEVVPRIYHKLNSNADAHSKEIKSLLQDSSWIWMGEKFVPLEIVSLKSSINAYPYLLDLPKDLQVYSMLLSLFHIKSSFSFGDYAKVLYTMAKETHASGEDDDQVSVLNDSQFEIAISIISSLSSTELERINYNHLYLPDETLRLRRPEKLVNDDIPWLTGPEYFSIRRGCMFIHPNISSKIAQKFGVKSLRSILVSKNVEQNIFNEGAPGASFESFGQAESLTSRLKNILDMYPDGNPIFSELIQNADDAGATVLSILLDENSYSVESLLDPKLSFMQGPSLIVRNDAIFSEADFRSLARIGQGSKLEKLSTTGRFGLGFNSTYHITDTPTFISGDYLVMFDPHCEYVPGANMNQPGIRIRLNGSNIRETFKDQFEPFMFFGCDCQNNFNGTIFRFPLRTDPMARKSEISKKSYSIEDMRSSLDVLIENLQNMLLFLRSVTQIEIYEAKKGEREPTLLYIARSQKNDFHIRDKNHLLEYFDKKKAFDKNREDFYRDLEATASQDLPAFSYKIEVEVVKIHEELKVQDEKDINFFEFQIQAGMFGGKAKSMATDPKNRHLKLVPLGSIATCLSRKFGLQEVETLPKIEGRAFSFLPLPVKTGFPLHLNAYWELSSNRRDIWKGDDTSGEAKLKSEWNTSIMQEVLSPLLLETVLSIKKMLSNDYVEDKNKHLCLFPLTENILPPWDHIVHHFYELIGKYPLIWSQHLGKRYFQLDELYIVPEGFSSTKNRIMDILLADSIYVIQLPKSLFTVLIHYSVSLGELTPRVVRKLYRNKFNALSLNPELQSKKDLLSNSSQLLQFCFQDMEPSLYPDLVGLPLLPLEDESLGTIQDPSTSAYYYITNDTEKAILERSKHFIVASSALAQFDQGLMKHISSTEFSEVCNIKKVDAIDLLKLLTHSLPTEWTNISTLYAAMGNYIDDEWLNHLWKYIIQNEIIELFRDLLPIVPILSPQLEPSTGQRYVCKISHGIPILHHSFGSLLGNDIIHALAEIGIFVADPSNLETLLYSKEVSSLFIRSPSELIAAFQSVFESSPHRLNELEIPSRRLLHRFLLDHVLQRIPKFSEDEIQMIKSLPLWAFHSKLVTSRDKGTLSGRSTADEEKDYSFSNLLSPAKWIPPDEAPGHLLNENFLYVFKEEDKHLLAKLNVPKATYGIFFSDHFIPVIASNASTMRNEDIDETVNNVLKDFPRYLEENRQLKELFQSNHLIRNQSGELCLAKELYFSATESLESFLPPRLLLDTLRYVDASVIAALRQLGLREALNCQGVLEAAKYLELQADQDRGTNSVILNSDVIENRNNENDPMNLSKNALGLMKHLEERIDRLLEESDPDSLSRTDIEGDSAHLTDSIGKDWGFELRSIRWVPVFYDVPVKLKDTCLPWPEKVHFSILAAPLQCTNYDNIWLSSSTHRISMYKVTNLKLLRLLGWCRPAFGRNLAIQLIKISQKCEEINFPGPLGGIDYEKNLSKLESVFYQIMDHLLLAFQRESQNEIQLWLKLLSRKKVILIRNIFVETNRVSLKRSSHLRIEPFLFVLPSELERYRELFIALGMKETFEPEDLVLVTQSIYEAARPTANDNRHMITDKQASLCVGIVMLLFKILCGKARPPSDLIDAKDSNLVVFSDGSPKENDHENPTTDQNINPSDFHPDSPDLPYKTSREPNALLDDSTSAIHEKTPLTYDKDIGSTSPDSEASSDHSNPLPPDHPVPSIQELVANLGTLYLPSRDNELLMASDLVYNDAPWVTNQFLLNQNLNFVHDKIPDAVAKTFGCRSFREYLFSGEEMRCPSIEEVQRSISSSPSLEFLHSFLSLAESASAMRLEILFDPREYKKESLIYPSFSDTQGASIIVRFPDASLDTEKISKCFSILKDSVTSQEKNLLFADKDNLMPCFAITDCVQILSRNSYFVYDPCGIYLRNEHTTAANLNSSDQLPKARRFPIYNRSKKESILSKFPDQFAAFTNLPYDLKGLYSRGIEYDGTIIRLPLRAHKSLLSTNTQFSTEKLKQSLGFFIDSIMGSLIFSRCLDLVTISHYEEDSKPHSVPKFDAELRLKSNRELRNNRFSLLEDKGWKRQGLSKLFASYSPSETMYSLELAVKLSCKPWIEFVGESKVLIQERYDPDSQESFFVFSKKWLLISGNGFNPLRKAALTEPLVSIRMAPFVSIAIDLSLLHSHMPVEQYIPTVGKCYSYAKPLFDTGLPFHIESQFLFQPFSSIRNSQHSQDLIQLIPYFGQGVPKFWTTSIIETALKELFLKGLTEARSLIRSGQSPSLIYQFIPFTPRLVAPVKDIALQLNLYDDIARQEVMVLHEHFTSVDKIVLPQDPFPMSVLSFIQQLVPVNEGPFQFTRDLCLTGTDRKVLTPFFLRSQLSLNGQRLARILQENLHILFFILQYVLADIKLDPELGEFTLRRRFKELMNCPLLLTVSEEVVCFPTSPANKVAIVPPLFHRFVPTLSNKFIHQEISDFLPPFKNDLFLSTLFISKFNPEFIAENISHFLPSTWIGKQNIQWRSSDGPSNPQLQQMTASSLSRLGHQSLEEIQSFGPSEKLIFSLWNYALSNETFQSLTPLWSMPLLPVVVRDSRVLLPLSFLKYIFINEPSGSQDQRRSFLKNECGRVKSIVLAQTNDLKNRVQTQSSQDKEDPWLWTSQPFSQFQVSLPPQIIENGKEPSALSNSSNQPHQLNEGTNLNSYQQPEPSSIDLNQPLDQQMQREPNEEATAEVTDTTTAVSQSLHSQNEVNEIISMELFSSPNLSKSSSMVLKIGIPLLDAGMFESIPRAFHGLESEPIVIKLLKSLHFFATQMPSIYKPIDSNGNADQLNVIGDMIRFDLLSLSERNSCLKELYSEIKKLASRSDLHSNLNQLKEIPLFTDSKTLQGVFLSKCKGGIYWCQNESVLAGVELGSNGSFQLSRPQASESNLNTSRNFAMPLSSVSNSSSVAPEVPPIAPADLPIILLYEPSLVEVYEALDIEELTPSTLISKFIIPTLSTLDGEERLNIMRFLSEKWGNYCEDPALVDRLKEVQFIPMWEWIDSSSQHLINGSYRKASELFIWTNNRLLDTLEGPDEPKYFPPPDIRTPEFQAMLSDLGIQTQLNQTSFIQIATDIQNAVSKVIPASNLSFSTDATERALAGLMDRSKRLLRYCIEQDLWSSLLQSRRTAQQIGKIKFVPIKRPSNVLEGGYIEYENRVGCFSQLQSRQSGPLCFSVSPILEEDISPPQLFYSSLGVSTIPEVGVVLKHLDKLTLNGESLDRWNSFYTIEKTFGSIFQFLSDQWATLNAQTKQSISQRHLIPIDKVLISPQRIFFRLTEDFSPFMYEIPRSYGQYENFLKLLGVQEAPSPAHYVLFLSELYRESHGTSLNPNELKAVLAILSALFSASDSASMDSHQEVIYIPDEDSILTDSRSCLLNDDVWIRGHALPALKKLHFSIVHPSISPQVARFFGIQSLRDSVYEVLDSNQSDLTSIDNEATLVNRYSEIFRSSLFRHYLASFLVNLRSDQQLQLDALEDWLVRKLDTLRLRFVKHFKSQFWFDKGGEKIELGMHLAVQENQVTYLDRKSSSGKTSLIIDSSRILDPITHELAVSIGLCELLKIDQVYAPSIACFLTSDNANATKVFDSLHMGLDEAFLRERKRGTPGQPLVSSDIQILEIKPFKAFRIGETIAFQDDKDLQYYYGKVVGIDMVTQGQIANLSVNSGRGVITLPSVEVFCFKPSKSNSDDITEKNLSKNRALGGNINSPNALKSDQPNASIQAPEASAISSPPPLSSSSQVLLTQDGSSKPKDNKTALRIDYYGAIEELMVRAGIPIDLDKKKLMSKIVELEVQNKRIDLELKNERTESQNARKTVDSLMRLKTCQICFNNEVSHTLVPCGHTFCEDCIGSLRTRKCPICRSNFSNSIKFYLNEQS